MPDLKELKVLIIGSGPITIGQSGESHEGAFEACLTLAGEGCQLLTIDANPDAVFNATPCSHHPHIEPLTPETIYNLFEEKKPDAVLTHFGGRNGLHLLSNLYENNSLSNESIQIWGPSKSCLESIRDRDTLQSALTPIGLKTPPIFPVKGIDAAVEKAQQIGFPVVLRCDDPQVLPDGLLVYNQDDLNRCGATLPGASSIKFSVEASLLEWQQIELEILRDQDGHAIVIDAIEYMDTAWVHPGDAIGVCPPQILPKSLKKTFLKHCRAISSHLNIIGGATIRFAYHPKRHDLLVLAVHPRYTTSSAIVSQIKGIPIAKFSTLLTAGFSMDQFPSVLKSDMSTEMSPAIIGIKWPNWDFNHLDDKRNQLGPQMQATGYSLGYGDYFKEAIQKAARSGGLDRGSILSEADRLDHEPLDVLLQLLATPTRRRPFELFAALRKGATTEQIAQFTHISPWFVNQLRDIMDTENRIKSQKNSNSDESLMRQAKVDGFSNVDIEHLLGLTGQQLEKKLKHTGVVKHWKAMPGQRMNHCYSSFLPEAVSTEKMDGQEKIIVIGNGAYGIENGQEYDYAIQCAAQTIQGKGYTPVIINSTLSKPSITPGGRKRCYYEPLNIEDIVDVIQSQKPQGIITQFAGSAADRLYRILTEMDYPLLGTPEQTIQLHQDRFNLKSRLRQFGIPMPLFEMADTPDLAIETAEKIGYPVLVSDPQKDAAACLCRDPQALQQYLNKRPHSDRPLLIEQLLEYAIEAQAEVLSDGDNTHVAAILEHIELAGVHAGDSAAVLPPYSIAPRHVETITEHCHKVAAALGIKGLINIRFAIYRDTVYLLETAGHISRNLAMVSRTYLIPLVDWATRLILGDPLRKLDINVRVPTQCSVRAPVFPFNAFSKIDPLLGPNMRSTGQVMALADTFGMAYFKAMEATSTPLPTHGTVLITVTNEDKSSILEPARIFSELGFKIMATKGTHKVLADQGIESTQVRKLGYGRPNLVDEIKNGHVQIVINTPTGGQGQIDDSVIRKAAIRCRVFNITTPASALAAAKGIAAALNQEKRQ